MPVDVQLRLQFFWDCNFERRSAGLAQQPTAEEETDAANLKAQRGRRETAKLVVFASRVAVCVVSQRHLR